MGGRTILIAMTALSVGCTVGPNYKRPATNVPASFRAPAPLPPAQAASIADLKWFVVFKDEKLQELIRTALERNYDLRDAAARVEQSRASLGITRSNQFPNFVAGGNLEINRLSRDGATELPRAILPSQNRNFGSAALQLLSFEIDIWGRLRRATEAARANLLSAEENRQAVITTLVSDVATAYLTLRELDYTLDISQHTLETRQQSLGSTSARPNNWCTRRRRPSPPFRSRLSRQRIGSPCCLGKIPALCRGAAASRNRSFPPLFPPACRPPCCSVVPISGPPSRI
jgi:multidrug efflux system outer membrane protein